MWLEILVCSNLLRQLENFTALMSRDRLGNTGEFYGRGGSLGFGDPRMLCPQSYLESSAVAIVFCVCTVRRDTQEPHVTV